MAETLLPVDVEVAARDELLARMPGHGFDGLVVATRIPAPRPAEFVRVVAMGGGQRDAVTDSPTVRVEAYAGTEGRAQRICAFSLASLQAAARAGRLGGAVCYGASVAALPQNLPNPQVTDRFRFFTTLSLDVRRVKV